jgi:glucose-6-phosphate 1-dehydrogenase
MKFFLTFFLLCLGIYSLTFGEVQNVVQTEEGAIHSFNNSQTPSPCVIVIFGATGDLTARKLVPALYHLAYDKHLSEKVAIVGFARGENTHEGFREKMGNAMDQFSRTKPKNLSFWNQFKNKIFYHRSEFESDEGYDRLRKFLTQMDQELGTQGNRIYYLATQPSYFPTIIAKLKEHHLIYEGNHHSDSWSRIIIEKPFGYDLDSAVQLQQQISQHLAESQIYRMDHYLCKEGVQNLFTFRFENGLFEPIWNHHHIDNIQITLAEEIGIGSRARLWEESGALRDIFQNHLMQLLALIAMEPPTHLNAKSIHQAKIQLLKAIRPFSPSKMEEEIVRGQYDSGMVQGTQVIGYREEKGVSAISPVETFVALKLFIDNERWQGVPFYIRGGKRLAKQTTEIAITFKKNALAQEQNVLFIRIQPHAGIFLKTLAKVPGLQDRLQTLVFGYKPDVVFSTSSPEAYERGIFDCVRGNDHLFVSAEEQFAAWRLLTPILDYWKLHTPTNFPNYKAGTWGPVAADQILLNHGHQWQVLEY